MWFQYIPTKMPYFVSYCGVEKVERRVVFKILLITSRFELNVYKKYWYRNEVIGY